LVYDVGDTADDKHVLTVYQIWIQMCFMCTDSDIVLHRSSRLYVLLCTCSVARC